MNDRGFTWVKRVGATKLEGLSHRAKIFRSKLIDDFQILETTSEKGKRKVPVYSTTDVRNRKVLHEILSSESPDQMIKFKVCKRNPLNKPYNFDSRLILVINRRKVPFGVWASLVVESYIFQNVLLVLTLLNSITLGLLRELPNNDSSAVVAVKRLIGLIDILTVIMFCVNIILKWIDNFREFWNNKWNLFELLITLVYVASPFLSLFAKPNGGLAIFAEELSAFRILRTLIIIKRISRLKIIFLTVLRTLKTLTYVSLLLLIVSYIYALVGVIAFKATHPPSNLKYGECFNTFFSTMVTLFQLVTLDKWYNVYLDISQYINPAGILIYILLWIMIGSFIFRNLIIGFMVNNFQILNEELMMEKENVGKFEEIARIRKNLSFEISRHHFNMKKARISVFEEDIDVDRDVILESKNQEKIDLLLTGEEKLAREWDRIVQNHLIALPSSPTAETLWPRDTLFKYYEAMEQLQTNLEEWEKLEDAIAIWLLEMHISDEFQE